LRGTRERRLCLEINRAASIRGGTDDRRKLGFGGAAANQVVERGSCTVSDALASERLVALEVVVAGRRDSLGARRGPGVRFAVDTPHQNFDRLFCLSCVFSAK
jgi:hypothetical protein